jgi:hypothetical protein
MSVARRIARPAPRALNLASIYAIVAILIGFGRLTPFAAAVVSRAPALSTR